MATKKVYPFIKAEMRAVDVYGNVECRQITFDAREVAYYHHWKDLDGEEEEIVKVGFKSGNEMTLYLALDTELYPEDNLITAIDMVQYSHYWHDNEDSIPDEDEE